MSQFTTGFRTMERQRDAEANFCDSSNLLQSEPNSPDVWEPSTMNNNGTAPKRYKVETPKPILKNGGVRFTHPSEYNEKDAADLEDVDQMVPGKPEFPDWRRSAVLTVFIFPPTGLLAMILACLSHSSAQKGDYERARRLNCCSCWMVFISLLGSLTFIMICILFRVYGVLDPPF